MNCPLCKNEIREGFVYCPFCGRILVAVESKPHSPNRGRKVCATISLIAGVLGLLNVLVCLLQSFTSVGAALLWLDSDAEFAANATSMLALSAVLAFAAAAVAFTCGLTGIVCGIIARKGVATVLGIIFSIASVVGSCCLTTLGTVLILAFVTFWAGLCLFALMLLAIFAGFLP